MKSMQGFFILFFFFYFSLFTTDGRHRIIEPSELEDNGQYVAVGRELL